MSIVNPLITDPEENETGKGSLINILSAFIPPVTPQLEQSKQAKL